MREGRVKVAYVTLPWELLSAEIWAEAAPNSLSFPVLFFSRTISLVERCSQMQNTLQAGSSNLL